MTALPLHPALAAAAAALAWLALAGPAAAQYKVVGPDGSVTYTDRPRVEGNARVTPLRGDPGRSATPAELALPLDLRGPVQRHPVTLYTAADCTPCDEGRRLLQTRGVPYVERRIVTEADATALEQLLGTRSVPQLRIGTQPLRGFAQTEWSAFLDAAGYPRESRLPRGWQPPAPTPLVPTASTAPPPTPAAPEVEAAPPSPPPPAGQAPGSVRIRF